MDKKIYKIIFWLTLAGVSFLFFLPVSAPGERIFGLDKIYHFFVFGGLAWIALGAYGLNKYPVLYLALYAFIVEMIQLFLPYRSFDFLDSIAGLLGIAVVTGFYVARHNNLVQK